MGLVKGRVGMMSNHTRRSKRFCRTIPSREYLRPLDLPRDLSLIRPTVLEDPFLVTYCRSTVPVRHRTLYHLRAVWRLHPLTK